MGGPEQSPRPGRVDSGGPGEEAGGEGLIGQSRRGIHSVHHARDKLLRHERARMEAPWPRVSSRVSPPPGDLASHPVFQRRPPIGIGEWTTACNDAAVAQEMLRLASIVSGKNKSA